MSVPTAWSKFARFSSWTDAKIADRIRLYGTSNLGLSNCSPRSARAEIRTILASIYIPSTQVLVTIRKALAMLEAHARVHYSDQHAYRSTINAAHRKPAVVRPLCITGLPGVGKTALCESLIRLMDEKPVIEVGAGYEPVRFQLARHVKVTAVNSIADVLKQVVFGTDEASRSYSLKELGRVGARSVYRDGLLLAMLDEMQMVARGENASVNVVKLLLATVDLGIPVIHSSNFINVAKIMRSGMEITDRLMVNSEVMVPEQSDDPAEFELRKAYEAATCGAVPDDERLWSVLNDITLRIHRTRIELLCLAFELARQVGRSKISIDDLTHAALSPDFAPSRASVVALSSMAISGRPVVGRKDLVCPLGVHFAFRPGAKQELERAQSAAVEEVAVMSSLTPLERSGLTRIQKDQTPNPSTKPKKRARPPTFETLVANALRYAE